MPGAGTPRRRPASPNRGSAYIVPPPPRTGLLVPLRLRSRAAVGALSSVAALGLVRRRARRPRPRRTIARPARIFAELIGDQHDARPRQHDPGGRGARAPVPGGGLSRQGRGDRGPAPAPAEPGGPAARVGRAQADPAARPSRRGGGAAGGLVARAVRADREGRLLLRPRARATSRTWPRSSARR